MVIRTKNIKNTRSQIGGIVGELSSAYSQTTGMITISDCINAGFVNGSGRIGGIVGMSNEVLTINKIDIMLKNLVNGGVLKLEEDDLEIFDSKLDYLNRHIDPIIGFIRKK